MLVFSVRRSYDPTHPRRHHLEKKRWPGLTSAWAAVTSPNPSKLGDISGGGKPAHCLSGAKYPMAHVPPPRMWGPG